jgi:hypothetical protein
MSRNAAAAGTSYKFRLIVHGRDAEGVHRRRVQTIDAPTFEDAWAMFEAYEARMAKGLKGVRHTVLPPVGWRVDGRLSKGFVVAK